MYDILSVFSVLHPHLLITSLRQFSGVVFGLLAMTGRVSMLNLSRWTSEGGSYRTLQRFFNTVIPWGSVYWVFFRTYLLDPEGFPYILAGDETVVSKSGQSTYGLSRFFSSGHGKTIPSLAFLGLSLVSLLFSSDLALDAETLIDYYALRFQIEFNFRDAKQFWGLEDFMNVNKTPVNNAANLSMFMVNVSAKLLAPLRLEHAECSVLDLKASYRGMKYLRETLKILPQKLETIVIDEIAERLGSIGETIHHTPSQLNTS